MMAKSEAPGAEPEADADSDADAAAAAPEFEAVNEAKALWTRPRNDVSEDEYKAFYKHVSHDFEDPLVWSHNRVEGKLEYTSLLYVPKRAPFDMWNRDTPRGVKLFVQRVFIMDDAESFLPLYLRFVKGVVDSNDLPLNVSREILQQDDKVDSIRSALTKRVLSMLEKLAKDSPDDYAEFWKAFGEVLKEGAGGAERDFGNRETLCGLLRFASTHSVEQGDGEQKTVSLADYLERKPDSQDNIYYVIADSLAAASGSPHLEALKAQGIEVLLLFDRIDEWLMSSLPSFQEISFQDVARSNLDLPEPADDSADDDAAKDLAERIAKALGERVDEARVSRRLTDSAACLVLSEQDVGAQMRRIMEAAGQALPPTKPIFEFNAGHPLVQRLDQEADEDRFADLALILFDQAALAEGRSLDDPRGVRQSAERPAGGTAGSGRLSIGVIGGGSFGTAVANIAAANGVEVALWMRDPVQAEDVRTHGENRRYLPGHRLNPHVVPTADLAFAAAQRELVFVIVPSASFREACGALAPHLTPEHMVISGTKGIEGAGFTLMSDIIAATTPARQVGVISGPNLAEEMAQGQYTGTVIASRHAALRDAVQRRLHTETFRVYASDDPFGVELAGALKNIYAIVCGLASGLSVGSNTVAMLVTPQSGGDVALCGVHGPRTRLPFSGSPAWAISWPPAPRH